MVDPAREPTVSIIICTRNRAGLLEGTLASLEAIRTDQAWEAVLADNGSTDDSAVVIAARADRGLAPIRYVHVARIGLGAARAAATEQARGEILCFTDDDCYLQPDFVDRIVEVFAEHPDVGCVGGRINLFDPQDARVTIDERDAAVSILPRRFVPTGALHGANISFRREALVAAGGFDPGLGAGTPYPCEDIDAVAAVLWAGYPARFDPRPVVFHHHRRRVANIPKLMKGYTQGRGAYFARYILRPDSRSAYIRGWLRHAMSVRSADGVARTWREIGWYFHYLRSRGQWLEMAASTGLAALVMAAALSGRLRAKS